MTCGAGMCTFQNGGSRKKSRSQKKSRSKLQKRSKKSTSKRSSRRKHRGGAVRSGSLVQGNIRP